MYLLMYLFWRLCVLCGTLTQSTSLPYKQTLYLCTQCFCMNTWIKQITSWEAFGKEKVYQSVSGSQVTSEWSWWSSEVVVECWYQSEMCPEVFAVKLFGLALLLKLSFQKLSSSTIWVISFRKSSSSGQCIGCTSLSISSVLLNSYRCIFLYFPDFEIKISLWAPAYVRIVGFSIAERTG